MTLNTRPVRAACHRVHRLPFGKRSAVSYKHVQAARGKLTGDWLSAGISRLTHLRL